MFVDCDETLNIDVTKIEAKITKKTKAIMAVHIYGRLCNMKEIHRIARKHKLYVIEDACEAQGAVYGSKADVTCWSFYKNKIIAGEEGGMVTTNHKWLVDKVNLLKCMAFRPQHDYFHDEIGYNYRMSNAHASLILHSFKQFSTNFKKRRQVEQWYNALIPKDLQMPARDTVWVYDVKIPFKDVPGVRHFFKPLSMMPMWKQKVGKNAERYSQYMYLPVYPDMKKKDVEHIVTECLKDLDTSAAGHVKSLFPKLCRTCKAQS